MRTNTRYIPTKIRKYIYERDNEQCQICGDKTRFFNSLYDSPFDKDDKAGSIDHIIPFSMGGSNEPDNLRWA
ncbi:MAG: HNH endonuclease, partial [Waddliaceae bacterium]